MKFSHDFAAKIVGFTIPTLVVLASIVLMYSSSYAGGNGTLTLTIDNVRNSNGVIHLMVYNRSAPFNSFDTKGTALYKKVKSKKGKVSYTFKNVGAGKYAIFVHHDENANGTFEMEGQISLEGYAYSKGVGISSYPTFSQAALKHNGKSLNAPLTMHYAK